MNSLPNLKSLLRTYPLNLRIHRGGSPDDCPPTLFAAGTKRPAQDVSGHPRGYVGWTAATYPRARADTSETCVREKFSGPTRKTLVRRIPDTCADTSGHLPPKRIRGGGSLVERPPRGRRAVVLQ
jgi:hypothetical protein